jgi:hypothetical protein
LFCDFEQINQDREGDQICYTHYGLYHSISLTYLSLVAFLFNLEKLSNKLLFL